MKINRCMTLGFLASVNLLVCINLPAQVPDLIVIQPPTQVVENIVNQYVPLPAIEPLVSIVFPNRGSVTTRSKQGLTPMVGILASETVNIQVTFPATSIGQTVMIEAFDSGLASAENPDETLGPDAVVPFLFTAGDEPGLYRIVVRVGEIVFTLQFWVANLDDPDLNPPLLSPKPGSPGPR